jgi:hypothetical protein
MLPVPVRRPAFQTPVATVPKVALVEDDIDYDCHPVEIPAPRAVRLYEQEEFLEEIYKPEPTFGALIVRLIIVWTSPYFRLPRR